MNLYNQLIKKILLAGILTISLVGETFASFIVIKIENKSKFARLTLAQIEFTGENATINIVPNKVVGPKIEPVTYAKGTAKEATLESSFKIKGIAQFGTQDIKPFEYEFVIKGYLIVTHWEHPKNLQPANKFVYMTHCAATTSSGSIHENLAITLTYDANKQGSDAKCTGPFWN